ncbi:MAG TPA: ParA family protein [Tepidisphaeraceae bacterium]|nr:ParA family protein [Tepidisphaeraceae bacterium]
MRVIALMNQKGGVGKTTTTVNLGAALAEAGKRVCLIDLDPQAHLTINYGVEPSPDVCSLYNVLVEESPITDALQQVDTNVSLVPSSIDLAAAEIDLVSVMGREQILKKRLEAADFDYDYVLLDCPPSLGLLTLNALSVANEVLIPMLPHFLALQGVGKLLETVLLVSRRMNPGLKVTGIVLTMFDSQTKLSGEVLGDLNSFIESAKGKPLPWASARIFKSKIRRNIKLAESPSFGKTIIKYDPTSNGAADYRALAKELLAMEGVAVAPGSVPAEVRNAPSGQAISTQSAVGSGQAAVSSAAPAPAAPSTPFSRDPKGEPQATPQGSAPAPVTTAPPLTEAPAPKSEAPKPPKPVKPKAAVLVSPAEAAKLKAAKVIPASGSAEPAPETSATES